MFCIWPCSDPESFVRGGVNFDKVFFFFFFFMSGGMIQVPL